MVFDAGLINLILYCAQQLGVALGLGAQTIMLVAYVTAMRDRVIEDTEAKFLRATRSTLWVSLVLIVFSGAAITAVHYLAGQTDIVQSPAYLFKLALIAAVIALTASLYVLPETFAEGLLGGTWYALFMVHILGPVTSWQNLLELYAVWMVGFNLVWYIIAFSSREKKQKSARPEATAEPKEVRKPFFSFSFLHRKPKPELIAPMPKPAEVVAIAKPVAPKAEVPPQFKPITFERMRTPEAAPLAVPKPLEPIPVAPVQQIKTDPVPKQIPQMPVEKMPGRDRNRHALFAAGAAAAADTYHTADTRRLFCGGAKSSKPAAAI